MIASTETGSGSVTPDSRSISTVMTSVEITRIVPMSSNAGSSSTFSCSGTLTSAGSLRISVLPSGRTYSMWNE
jgi:hypothetical protein